MDFGKYIAHRGLHGGGIPENSMAAFEKAIAKGLAIELDIRMTKDCRLVVFHDADLLRMCGTDIKLSELEYSQLAAFPLSDCEEKIPLFSDVLKLVDSRVPLLIEIKRGSPYGTVEKRLMKLLKGYNGEYAVQSFDPLILLWFRLHAPKVCRGQLVTGHPSGSKKEDLLERLSSTKPVWKYITKPDFLSFDLRTIEMEDIYTAQELGADVLSWTADTPELRRTARAFSRSVISEWK